MKTTSDSARRNAGIEESLPVQGTKPTSKILRQNRNRGYMQLRVWQDAIELYKMTVKATKGWPFEQKKLVSQALASSDSVHRNIAEGYCRRSIKEYIQHLYIALASLGESVSGYHAYHVSGQLDDTRFEAFDALAFRLENGLLRLVESLEHKRERGEWTDSLILRESNDPNRSPTCDTETHYSTTP